MRVARGHPGFEAGLVKPAQRGLRMAWLLATSGDGSDCIAVLGQRVVKCFLCSDGQLIGAVGDRPSVLPAAFRSPVEPTDEPQQGGGQQDMESVCDPQTVAWLTLAATLFGFLVGTRSNLWLKRRDERIAVADRLYEVLVRQAAEPSPYLGVQDRDLDLLVDKTPGLMRRLRVRRLVASYQAAKDQRCKTDAAGQLSYTEPERVRTAAAALLRHCGHD